jgi:chorismate mutase/prephenate dehydratase
MDPVVLLHVSSHRPLALRAVDALTTVTAGEVLAMATVAEVLETVEHTPGCAGLLPVEDSYGGEDTAVLDRLIFGTSRVYVAEEVVVGETLDAFGVPSDEGPVEARTAVSEPRAIEHCRRFIQENGLLTRFVGSTQGACRVVAESGDPSLVAIAPREVADAFGLVPVAASVGDVPEARTRFFLVSRSVAGPTGHDKTTLVLTQPADRSGNLQRFLAAFTDHGVNLVSLHSRPLASAAEFCFIVTAEAHIHEPRMAAAIGELWRAGAQIKLVGSYPHWTGDHVVAPFGEPPASVGRQSPEAERATLLGAPAPTA